MSIKINIKSRGRKARFPACGSSAGAIMRPRATPISGPMLPKIIIVVLLISIVATLMVSMSFLVRDASDKKRTLTALKIRVALSLTLIAFVILSYLMGWIHPHPGPVG